MAIFQTKITHARLTLSPFSSEQMSDLGKIMIGVKLDRITQAINSQDSPAKPLVDRYAKRKIQRNRAPVRDWLWRGLTRGSAKVIIASEDRVVIGFINPEADRIVTAQRRREEMWSDSPNDKRALSEAIKQMLQAHRVVVLIRRRTA